MLQPQVKGLGDLAPVALAPGDTAPLEDVVRRLADAAYSRVDLVEKRGEFAVRGGIVDVFPPTEEHPLRVEFWGDDVDEIRSFAVADQRTLEAVDRLWAPPCRELLLTDEVRRRAAELGQQHPQLVELTDKIAAGIAVEGMESLTPVLVDEMELLVDLMPDDTHVLVVDPERARSRAHDLVATSEEFLGASWAAAAGGGTAPIDLGAASYRAIADVRQHSIGLGRPWWTMSPFGLDGDLDGSVDDDTRRRTRWRAGSCRRGRPSPTAATSRPRSRTSSSGAATATGSWWSTPATGPAQRMAEVLGEHDVPARLVDQAARGPAGHRRRHGDLRVGRPRVRGRDQPAGAARPATTCRDSAPRPATCGGCRRGASGRSTRSSSRPATTSCTSSTAWAGSWR